jgi:hypothetical protein
MEIFVRLFVWILNFTYGRRGGSTLYGQNPMDEVLLREHQEESESKRKDRLVEEFKSAAAPVQGAVDYEEMKWESFSRVVETPEQFLFYSDRSMAKVMAKSSFSSRQQVLALRRVIRRHVANGELLDDL